MADTKISALDTTTSGTVGDYVPIVQGGVTKKVQLGTGGGLDAGKLAGMTPGTNLNADTVSGYGIGTVAKALASAGDMNALTLSGLYCSSTVQTNAPWAGENNFLLHFQQGANYAYQIAWKFTATSAVGMAMRQRLNSTPTWGVWQYMWTTSASTAAADGNGGQPPAPKPTASAGAGNFVMIATSSGAKFTLPADGQWCYFALAFVVASGTFSTWNFGAHEAGGTDVCVAVPGAAHYGFAWRTEQ